MVEPNPATPPPPPPPPQPAHQLGPLSFLPALLLAVAILVVGYLTEHRLWFFQPIQRQVAFVVIAVLLTLFAIVVGRAVTGLTWGVLIDDRNRMSLSRFQTALWTVVLVSAIFVAALSNVGLGADIEGQGALGFEIPGELWLLMGISVTSLVGAPLILEGKKKQNPDPDEQQATLAALEDQGRETADNVGLVVINRDPKDASWTDLFQADETGTAANLDLAKVQNFYFTLILVFSYSALLVSLFAAPGPITALPPVSEGMIALLGISHAAYLANKARAQSQTGPTNNAQIQGGTK